MHVVATAGHVDHGKSTLVRALTGTDPDRFEEERRRGLTIDLGFAWMTLPTAGPVEFVDVPGHIRFISNMLAGVAVVEAGLLCVDAREGWRAQTEEHLRILDLVELRSGLVALTKCGLVDADRQSEVRDEIAQRTAGTVLADAPVVACDAVDGTGLDDLRTLLDSTLARSGPGYGRSSAHSQGQNGLGRARMWVDRCFTIAGAGTVVTGGVSHGAFAVGDQVEAVCGRTRHRARVRGIQALGKPVKTAPAGSRAALNLAGLGRRMVRRGDAIVNAWPVTARVEASLTVLAGLDHEVTQRGAYLAYFGTAEQSVRLRLVDAETVWLTLAHPLPLAVGDRFVLRETGRSELIGGGEVLGLAPSRRRRRATEAELTPDHLAARINQARPVGLDVALLNERERDLIEKLDVEVVAGYAVAPEWRNELAQHPVLRRLARTPFSPPAVGPGDVSPEVMRALMRRGLIVTKGGVVFAASALPAAQRVLQAVARSRPDGFTVSEARQALGTTRKWAVPLLELLDEARITIRRGDRRHLSL